MTPLERRIAKTVSVLSVKIGSYVSKRLDASSIKSTMSVVFIIVHPIHDVTYRRSECLAYVARRAFADRSWLNGKGGGSCASYA